MASGNKGVCRRLDNGITVVAAVIYSVSTGDCNGGEAAATIEGIGVDAGDGVGDDDGGEAAAAIEGAAVDAGDGVGDDYGSEAATAREGVEADAGDGVGNDSIFASSNKGACRRFDNGIAVVAAVVYSVSTGNRH